MFETRDQIRGVYLEAWRKMQTGEELQPLQAMVADVIRAHPEYHALLDAGTEAVARDFLPEQGGVNPFLHMGMHIALREQASTDRPPGIADLYRRLVGERGKHAAEHAMMDCLGEALWRAQRDRVPADESGYLECLRKL